MVEEVKEEVKEVTAKEVEEAMIKAAEDHAQDITGMALNTYTHLYPKFMAGLHILSSKVILRLLKAIMDYPVNPGRYKLDDFEKQMLEIGSMMLESKFIMIMNTYAENVGELVAADDAAKEVVTEVEESTEEEGE